MELPIVDCKWLNQNLANPKLIILDASFQTPVANKVVKHPNKRITHARFFDLKGNFCDLNSEFPNTIPSKESFTQSAQSIGINQDSIIVCYDNLGIYTAPRAWWLLKVMGHKQVFVLDGGLNEWVNQGLPVEPIIEANYTLGNFEAKFESNQVINISQVLTNLHTQDFLVLDARSEGRFTGEDPEPRKELESGHIPQSINLPYTSVLEDGKMKSIDQLEIIFKSLNVNESPIVFSCGSGITACIILLAAELVIKNKKSVFDGSWTEWATKQKNLIHKK